MTESKWEDIIVRYCEKEGPGWESGKTKKKKEKTRDDTRYYKY